jgi:hypothetical protein
MAIGGEAGMAAREHCVPLRQDRVEEPGPSPFPDGWLAWRYLLPHSCMRRCVEKIDVYSIRLGRRFVEVDLLIPYADGEEHSWVVPLAYLKKEPIAPDLAVTDAHGAVVVVPTREETMAITCQAVRLLATAMEIELTDVASELIIRIVRGDPDEAQLARFVFEQEVDERADDLIELLYQLESQTLLWVRVDGEGGEDRHLRLERRAPRDVEPVLRRDPIWRAQSLQLGDGFADFFVPIAGPRRRIDFRQLVKRLLLTFGLRPIEVESELADTARFASFHHRVHAPRGFVVRQIRVLTFAEDFDPDADPEVLEEVMRLEDEPGDPPADLVEHGAELLAAARETVGGEEARKLAESEGEVLYEALPWSEFEEVAPQPGLVIQGHDSEIAHVRCSNSLAPTPLIVKTTLGTSPHLTSLWTLVVVLSAALLWLFDRRSPYPPLTDPGSHLEVAAGALLLAPTFAAAWVIRSDESAATRLVLSGTRFLLMLCGALSVCAALTLSGMLPHHFGEVVSVKLYASVAYLAATVVVVGWAVSLRPTWYLYRDWLTTPTAHAKVTMVLLILGIVLNLFAPMVAPCRYLCALGLFAVAMLIGAAAVDRLDGDSDESIGTPVVGGLAAGVLFVSAGYWFRFYDELASASTVRLFGVVILALLTAASFRQVGNVKKHPQAKVDLAR